MKRVVLLMAILVNLLFFNACKKDLDFVPEKENTHQSLKGKYSRSCAMHSHTQKLLKEENYRKIHVEKFLKIKNMVSVRNDCSVPVKLPVAVHFQNISNPDVACLRQLAQAQIKLLNDDYQAKNGDLDKWTNVASNYFPGINNGKSCIEFCLARFNHPAGFGLANGDFAVTVNKTASDFDARWAGYINIFVQPNTEALGYAPLGGLGDGDGIVIDASAFGSGSGCGSVQPQSPFDRGRTLTHEMGHYLLLDHIWGEGCGIDDGVDDTPECREEYYDCPQLGTRSCNSVDMHMNYMDYTNDGCMYVFTAGQSIRMENYLRSSLSHVIAKGIQVCDHSEGQEPTCEDGIQNGDETGIDCGGSNCMPCNEVICDKPRNISATVLDAVVKITFTPVTGANSYRIRYRSLGETIYQKQTFSSNELFLRDLKPGTTYEYGIRTICENSDSDFSTSAQFTTSDDEASDICKDLELNLALTLDDWGSETSYELVDEFGQVLASGGPFEDESGGDVIKDQFCLKDGCYYLVVYDDFGDGMCCEYGNGRIQLTNVSGEVLSNSNGYFGYEEYVDFCIDAGVFRIIDFKRPTKIRRLGGKVKKAKR